MAACLWKLETHLLDAESAEFDFADHPLLQPSYSTSKQHNLYFQAAAAHTIILYTFNSTMNEFKLILLLIHNELQNAF